MQLKILVVDDSSFFRRRVSEIINSDPHLIVIDTAANGKEAVEKARLLKPNVITMDIEMPVMNGIAATREIMATNPVPILMFSSLTHEGAKATLDALEAGALDFLPKRFEDIAKDRKEANDILIQRIKEIARFAYRLRASVRPVVQPKASTFSNAPTPLRNTTTISSKPSSTSFIRSATSRLTNKSYKLLVIGSSTGGPVALQEILSNLPSDYPLPILLIQHMPSTFTGAFAQRLNSLCQISVKEAANGDILKSGCAYLAPGGMQVIVERGGKLKIFDGGDKVSYKPSVDITFASISKVYSNDVLAIVLTGMGKDGCDGAKLIKAKGATIWAQDKETCVVYGMPHAIAEAGLADSHIALGDFAARILAETHK